MIQIMCEKAGCHKYFEPVRKLIDHLQIEHYLTTPEAVGEVSRLLKIGHQDLSHHHKTLESWDQFTKKHYQE